jgi:hypothetical protein
MGRASQSQDVEHQGPRTNPLDSRQRGVRSPSSRSGQDQIDREAEPDPGQQERGGSGPFQHETNTPSRLD